MKATNVIAVALLLGAGCNWLQSNDTWVADVDGTIVTVGDLEQAVAPRAERDPDARREDLLNEELERMVADLTVLNQARALGIRVTDAEVDARIRELVGGDAGSAVEVATPEYRATVRRQMRMDRTAAAALATRLQISESAIVHYFEEHRDQFAEPARVVIRQIVVQDGEEAEALLAELRGGADFEELARDHSIAPEAERGGLLPPFAKGEMPEEFDRAFSLKEGATSKVIASPFGYHIFKLEEKLDAWEPTLEDVRDRVREALAEEQLAELRREWQRELRRTARIRINEPALERMK